VFVGGGERQERFDLGIGGERRQIREIVRAGLAQR